MDQVKSYFMDYCLSSPWLDHEKSLPWWSAIRSNHFSLVLKLEIIKFTVVVKNPFGLVEFTIHKVTLYN
jgi:hypothetical protein